MSGTISMSGSVAALAGSRAAAYWELVKPGICGMVLVAVSLGFFMASGAGAGFGAWALCGHAMLGIGLVGGGANALNQYFEASFDARMVRTEHRPIPSGRIGSAEALAFGAALGAAGAVYLLLVVNPVSAVLASAALVSYVFIYTPLKRATPLCVFVGAVPGALPPVIGWAASAGGPAPGAWLLFAVLFFWQLPHFAAIAWLYRVDYARAGFPMLSVVDRGGARLSLHVVTHSVGLLVASLLPVLYGLAGAVYAGSAVVLGLVFLGFGVVFIRRRTDGAARRLLWASLVYLPLLVVAMLMDRVPVG